MVEDERRLLTFRGLSAEIRHFFGASIEYSENGGPRFASRRRVPRASAVQRVQRAKDRFFSVIRTLSDAGGQTP